MTQTVTRFLPSPTGFLHIGGLRTALYAYLLAKREGGKFVLRIEDTDRTRFVPEAVEHFQDMMEIFGLFPDASPRNNDENGPYIQSERLDIYQQYAQQLIESGHAYYCFCTPERLDEVRNKMQEAGLTPKYDGHCRDLTQDEIQEKLNAGIPHTIRLRVPRGEIITIHDEIRGRIDTPTADIDDQVLMKQDGYPTYHLASVVDDHLMGITVAMLGEEWIASGAKKKLIYDALDFPMPKLVYLPTILGSDRKKLSKRNGDTNVTDFLAQGYLIETIINYVALVGWNPKSTEEFFSLADLEKIFSLEGVAKSSGVFDREKLEWYNAQYISKKAVSELINLFDEHLASYHNDYYSIHWSKTDQEYKQSIVSELQTRLKTLSDLPELTTFFFEEPTADPDMCLHEKMKISSHADAKTFLEFSLATLETLPAQPDRETIKETYLQAIKKAGYKNGQILWPTRVALTGAQFSPGAIEMIDILGVEKSRERLQRLIDVL